MIKYKIGIFMKKILFAFMLIMMNTLLYSQSDIMKFLSMGFNARNSSNGGTIYYFYGYEDYSEAFVFNTFIKLSTGIPRTFYPNGLITYKFPPYEYIRYNGQNNSIGYSSTVPTIGYFGEEYKIENGKLVYYALTAEEEPYTTLERIEQNNQSITIYLNDSEKKFHYRYFNISRTELLDLFLKRYVGIICTVNEMVNENNYINELNELITPLLQGRTARELAIFRNCLFAIKGYKFTNSTWTDFFNKYLVGYNGRYTNDEVKAKFTENEKWLLDLIIKYENGR
jgi:hypothetical protein